VTLEDVVLIKAAPDGPSTVDCKGKIEDNGIVVGDC